MTTRPLRQAADPFERERTVLDALAAFLGDGGTPQVPGYVADAKGRLIPEQHVADHARLEDAAVRTIAGYALDLHRQCHRFRAHSYDDLAAMDDLTAERYHRKPRGGPKGNRTYMSIDGRVQVVVQVADRIAFGPELQVARQLIDECIAEWAEGARTEIQALVRHAFEPDKEGQVSREAVFALRRIEIDDPRWRQAQAAITDSIRIVGSSSYLRVKVRATPDGDWRHITIGMTGDPLPEEPHATP